MNHGASGGVSITPPKSAKQAKRDLQAGLVFKGGTLDKRIAWDWLSFTFDDLFYNVKYAERQFTLSDILSSEPRNFFIVSRLLRLLGSDRDWVEYVLNRGGVNNYKYFLTVGENIKLQFMGPRSKNDRPTAQLLMSGDACREFFNELGGSWVKLFKFLRELNGSFKRIDLAVDDFTGREVTVYDLVPLAQINMFTTSFQEYSVQIFYRHTAGEPSITGIALTFGKKGGNQYQIYDKMLERQENEKAPYDVEVWFRHEMRFVDEKALAVIDQYLLVMEDQEENQFALSDFAHGLLRATVEFKDPEHKVKQLTRRRIHPKWDAFLEHVKKTKLEVHYPKPSKILDKKDWFHQSLPRLSASILASDEDVYLPETFKMLAKGLRLLKDDQKVSINFARFERGLPELSDDDFIAMAEKYEDLVRQMMGEEKQPTEDDELPF